MRYVLIVILSLVFFAAGYPEWLLSEHVPNLCKACNYHFFHANIFHLAVNCLSIWMVFRITPRRGLGSNMKDLLLGYIIATLTFFTATRPVVGISNILFAVFGLRTPSFRSPWWKSANALTFFSVSLLMFAFPQFSAMTHVTSFILGTATAAITRYYNNLEDDYRHATGR